MKRMYKRKNNFQIQYIHTQSLFIAYGPMAHEKNLSHTQNERKRQRRRDDKCNVQKMQQMYTCTIPFPFLVIKSQHPLHLPALRFIKRYKKIQHIRIVASAKRCILLLYSYTTDITTFYLHRHTASMCMCVYYYPHEVKTVLPGPGMEYSVNHRIYFVHFYAISLYM